VIRVESLTVTFGHTVALDNIDVNVDPGITGLFGPNGSGKSTLLRVIAGLLRPQSGSVNIDSQEVRTESVRRRIGYSGHASGLYRDLSVRENLSLFARLYGAAPSRVDETLASLGLSDWSSVRTGALSAGLSRRATVARALVHDPSVLLLDEPYANLDDEAAELMSSAIRNWAGTGRAALIATHGAKKVKAFADAGIILHDGRVKTAGRYRREARVG
jgi:heme ABC exporter ATP-binding subunit CcmA